ncbi:allophanate hydrolase [Halocynthiibacter sp. C4]|uniref:allophanate hydrolase n=1 Tax=Halocynthiibacter sp. C4 TaxID=2992758 RepID=UPI00237AC39D|nr:allophanate hydrolase [Halocynthiibacter sp. C4]MDE0591563.1 allophanate hydrolase [Halocynthiibacter sp. C4]
MTKDKALTLDVVRNAYDSGATPADIVREVYRRIDAVADPAIFIHLRPMDDVIAEAEALPARSDAQPLWGVPFVAKDNIDVAGIPTTAACPAYAYTPEKDAFVVAKLRAAGALVIGKTNLDQFATGLVGVRSPYGVPKNAVDPEIVPGGSSSGSGVAVGHGFVTFSLGTDTAGSGRVPAALNNIVGLKPSLGALSATGVVPACRTLDTISIFAANVSDAFAAFQVACAEDHEDAYSKKIAAGSLDAVPADFKIGVPDVRSRIFFGDEVQAASFAGSLDTLKSHGATIVELDFSPFYAVAEMLYEGAWVAERYAVVEDLMRDEPDTLHPTTAKIIGAAEKLSAADAFRGIYRLKQLESAAQDLMGQVDLLCVPTIPTFYSVADLEADPVTPNSNLGTYTNFVNLLDMCGIAVPSMRRSDGRPGSITLLAHSGQDALVASIAANFAGETIAAAPNSATDTEIALAVCGAHMSGMALNHELTSRGGRLLEATRTAPRYRLYALAGGPPQRPGLLRIEKGAKIDLEVWALPKSAVGSFLEGIPAPLSIGTVELENGSKAHGFLVETTGVQGADDITHIGSWRKYQKLEHQTVD